MRAIEDDDENEGVVPNFFAQPCVTDEGIEEAKEAGRLLKVHGFEFDVV
jgi:bisphosphoglycerate-dependent phosphoglycerate mutase